MKYAITERPTSKVIRPEIHLLQNKYILTNKSEIKKSLYKLSKWLELSVISMKETYKTKNPLSRNQKTKTSSLQTQRHYKKLSVNVNIEKIFAKDLSMTETHLLKIYETDIQASEI